MHLIQFIDDKGNRAVGATEDGTTSTVTGVASVYAFAAEAAERGLSLREVVIEKGLGAAVDKNKIAAEGRLLAPVDHPDTAHLYVTGTGPTHLGSASTRDAMHKSNQEAAEAPLADSMKMFRMGLEGGKPAPGQVGVQPEWFYKGNGNIVAAPASRSPRRPSPGTQPRSPRSPASIMSARTARCSGSASRSATSSPTM
ncbi:MAG: hypothetical protein J0I99_06130 [Devosia sp.]|nr:hypothetical protein [Devosia sp.]